jgi:hypothetical protein
LRLKNRLTKKRQPVDGHNGYAEQHGYLAGFLVNINIIEAGALQAGMVVIVPAR